jgi:hypothetical protein
MGCYKRAVQLWKFISIYSEDMYSVLNCHNVGKHIELVMVQCDFQKFCMQMFHLMQDDERFLDSVIFSDESPFHVSGKVLTHNCRIWGS